MSSARRPAGRKALWARPLRRPTAEGLRFLWRRPAFWAIAFLLLGGAYRFTNLNWDFQHSFHPDERNILGQTAGIRASDGYRVRFFAYGQLPVFLYRATGELFSVPREVARVFGRHGAVTPELQAFWILFSLGLLAAAALAASREKWKVPAFVGGGALFALAVLAVHYGTFKTWFGALSGLRLDAACVLFAAGAALGLAALVARYLDEEFLGLPLWVAVGAVLALGVFPAVLSERLARLTGTLSFTACVLGSFAAFAWTSRVGRALLAVLALWTFLASLPEGHPHLTDYGSLMILGRGWSALFSTLTVGAVYLLVKRLYGRPWTAALAAGFFAFAAASIQVAHYCITESFLAFMGVVLALAAHRVATRGDWPSYLAAGAAFGIALSAKTSALYFLLFLVAGHVLNLARRPRAHWERLDRRFGDLRPIATAGAAALVALLFSAFAGVGWRFRGILADLFREDPGTGRILWAVLFALLAFAGALLSAWAGSNLRVLRGQAAEWVKGAAALALAFPVFCLLSPWSLLDGEGFLRSMQYEWRVVSHADAVYVLQFKDTPRYLFHLKNLADVEFGWPLGIAAVAGAAWVLLRFLAGILRPVPAASATLPVPFLKGKGFGFFTSDFLLLSWFLAYFGFIGAWNTKFIRYMIPLLPFFCVFAALLFAALADALARRLGEAGRRAAAGVALAVLGAAAFYGTAYLNVYRTPHPWFQASKWIYENVPPGSMILKEHWDDGLPTPMDPRDFPFLDRPRSPSEYRQQDVTVYELHGHPTDDTEVKKAYYANLLPQGDYLSIASKKLWYTLTAASPAFKPEGFRRYPVTSRYYRLLWTGLLGYEMVSEFHTFPSLFGWEHPDDDAEESFSVYDHPRVYLFQKVREVPADVIYQLLSTEAFVEGVDREAMRKVTPENVRDFIRAHAERLRGKGLLDEAGRPVFVEAPPSVEPAAPPPRGPSAAEDRPPDRGIPGPPASPAKEALERFAENPVVQPSLELPPHPTESAGYQLRAFTSWALLWLLFGFAAYPLAHRLFASLGAGAWGLSRPFGALLFAWAVWLLGLAGTFTTPACLALLLILSAASALAWWRNWGGCAAAFRNARGVFLRQDALFLLALLAFSVVRAHNPHIHDPVGEGYNGGGEAGMDFGFLASIVRGESFPPENMWMAGHPIGYTFYFGHLLMGACTKTLALVPAVTYNLAIATLFALVFTGAYALARGITGRASSGWIAGLLCAAAGNLEGARQLLRVLAQALLQGDLGRIFHHTYDYWGPSRVIPHSINEFPYFSVLFADLHAHLLAMPFAMAFVGAVLAYFRRRPGAPFAWRSDAPQLAGAAFLLGGLAFLNTWELPTWILLFALAALLRNFAPLPGRILREGSWRAGAGVAFALLLLGWVSRLSPPTHPDALGRDVKTLAVFLGLGWAAGAWMCLAAPRLRAFARRWLETGALLALLFLGAFLFWMPFFLSFEPQQNQVLWVWPKLRTSFGDYATIWGAFLPALTLGFLPSVRREASRWVSRVAPKARRPESLGDRALVLLGGLRNPQGPLAGFLAAGLLSLAFLVGASWTRWTEPPPRALLALALGTAVFLLAGLALFRRSAAVGLGALGTFFAWAGLVGGGVFKLYQDAPATLNLSLFVLLWLAAFLNLGLAARSRRDPALAPAYLLAALFFLLTALLEMFAMKEFLGGEWMRNNSLFKFGINAWTLASVSAGALLPAVWGALSSWVRERGREAALPRRLLFAASWFLAFLFFEALLADFRRAVGFDAAAVASAAVLLGAAAALATGLSRPTPFRWALLAAAALVLLASFLPAAPPRTVLARLQEGAQNAVPAFLLPLALSGALVGIGAFLWERRRDAGRRLLATSFAALAGLLFAYAAAYPLFATWRKCHGFLPELRERRLGYREAPTLNGLAYLARVNPFDAAAIRFLNDEIPGQPCLVEAVGLGYNSWGSRYSIFTGIPALMGWDGHVDEWVGRRLGPEIRRRTQVVNRLYNTRDPAEALALMAENGVSLVVVGPLEQGTLDPRKRYDPEGLAKFEGLLPAVYRNPAVSIYYRSGGASGGEGGS